LFAGLPLTAAEPLIEPTLPNPASCPACAGVGGVDPRALDSMRFELNGLRELLEVQLGSLAWNQLQGSRRNRPTCGAACSASACPARCPAICWR
jgi:flagellar biosynthesis protein FlhF